MSDKGCDWSRQSEVRRPHACIMDLAHEPPRHAGPQQLKINTGRYSSAASAGVQASDDECRQWLHVLCDEEGQDTFDTDIDTLLLGSTTGCDSMSIKSSDISFENLCGQIPLGISYGELERLTVSFSSTGWEQPSCSYINHYHHHSTGPRAPSYESVGPGIPTCESGPRGDTSPLNDDLLRELMAIADEECTLQCGLIMGTSTTLDSEEFTEEDIERALSPLSCCNDDDSCTEHSPWLVAHSEIDDDITEPHHSRPSPCSKFGEYTEYIDHRPAATVGEPSSVQCPLDWGYSNCKKRTATSTAAADLWADGGSGGCGRNSNWPKRVALDGDFQRGRTAAATNDGRWSEEDCRTFLTNTSDPVSKVRDTAS